MVRGYKRKPRGYWTKERCHKEALKYNKRKDFEVNSKASYAAAYRNGWVDEICSHMKRTGNKLFRCVYVYEFPDNYAYVGLTYDVSKRDRSRKFQNDDAVTTYIRKTNLTPKLKQISDYIHVDFAIELEKDLIEFYCNNGWKMLNKAKGGVIGGNSKKWNKGVCAIEALKYVSRSDFYRKSNKYYTAAQRNGWLDDICGHMIPKITHWTFKKCESDALRYKTRYEYSKKSHNSYVAAHRHGWLNKICKHMV
jgi:hypothetical protein